MNRYRCFIHLRAILTYKRSYLFREIAKKQPECEFFVPRGMQEWMVDNTVATKDRQGQFL